MATGPLPALCLPLERPLRAASVWLRSDLGHSRAACNRGAVAPASRRQWPRGTVCRVRLRLPRAATPAVRLVWWRQAPCTCALARVCAGDTDQASQSRHPGGCVRVSRQEAPASVSEVVASLAPEVCAVFLTPIYNGGTPCVFGHGGSRKAARPLSLSESVWLQSSLPQRGLERPYHGASLPTPSHYKTPGRHSLVPWQPAASLPVPPAACSLGVASAPRGTEALPLLLVAPLRARPVRQGLLGV